MGIANKIFGSLLKKAGYRVVKINPELEKDDYPVDFSASQREIIRRVKPYTMTSPERVAALENAVRYVSANHIEGSIVECGVWKGGSMMAALDTLVQMNDTSRDVFLYDTFEGMSEPTPEDKAFTGKSAKILLDASADKKSNSIWCFSTLEEVQQNVLAVGYPSEKIHFVKGKVEETIPSTLPGQIALLRLDTDWYESTRHELEHLYPLLVSGGVLIIDDYGHWEGARKAVDEYLGRHKLKILLNRIDYTGRIAIKI